MMRSTGSTRSTGSVSATHLGRGPGDYYVLETLMQQAGHAARYHYQESRGLFLLVIVLLRKPVTSDD